ncbi:hypothetical protein N7532_002704 [Penicillium argentinense]|uniref:Uncharacterized protein n=1 Tax=Penicillium argentinense TaxID=1131581 RepID=A0A9W9G0W1_9EURO|nr:uncharacterized protein N7532_002704 [Penicillium argentinense]KAJ5110059.1 hypothetical protein N7532_002704 [Penicillium argentinense]
MPRCRADDEVAVGAVFEGAIGPFTLSVWISTKSNILSRWTWTSSRAKGSSRWIFPVWVIPGVGLPSRQRYLLTLCTGLSDAHPRSRMKGLVYLGDSGEGGLVMRSPPSFALVNSGSRVGGEGVVVRTECVLGALVAPFL